MIENKNDGCFLVEPQPFEKKKRKWKKTLLILAFVLLLAGIFVFTLQNDLNGVNRAETVKLGYLLEQNWIYLMIAVAFSAAYIFCRALVHSTLMRTLTGKFRLGICLTITIIGRFYDNITPFASGGQPFQVYYLNKKNLPAGAAITLPLTEYIVNRFAMVFLSILALVLNITQAFGNSIHINTVIYIMAGIGILLNFGAVLLILTALISERASCALTRFFVGTAKLFRLTKNPDALFERIMGDLKKNLDCMKTVAKSNRGFVTVLCFLFSVGSKLAAASIFFFVLKTFGFHSPNALYWADIAVIFFLITMSVTFIPTPGNSGATDLSFYVILNNAIPGFGAIAMLLWRFISYYLHTIVGFFFVLKFSIGKKHMKKRRLSLKKIQKLLLELLEEIKETCEQHGIKFFLFGGSLLGAVRHSGFIPWDDDIDLAMPRADYEKFVDLQRKGLLKSEFHCNELNKKYKYHFGKYCKTDTLVKEKYFAAGKFGVYVDIFPLDGLGNSTEEAEEMLEKVKPYSRLFWASISRLRFRWILLIPPLTPLFFMWKYFYGKVEKICTKKPYDENAYVGKFTTRVKKNQIMPKELYSKTTMLEFGGLLCPAPENYHEWLRRFYGENYMTPPPEKERIDHSFKAYEIVGKR